MTNIVRFDDLDNAEIRVTDDGRYSVFDVIKFCCNKDNPRQVWECLTRRHTEVAHRVDNFKFDGKGQRNTPVVNKSMMLEILGILGCSPTQQSITSDRFYPRTEPQIVSVLVRSFHDCEPCTQFYCGGYRIDLYLAKHRIAIECDEGDHSAYCSKNESSREKTIKSALGCSFVRFNPYAKDFNLGDVVAEIRKLAA